MKDNTHLIEVENLYMYFPGDGPAFSKKESLTSKLWMESPSISRKAKLLVGRGKRCGKTTTGRCILQLYEGIKATFILKA